MTLVVKFSEGQSFCPTFEQSDSNLTVNFGEFLPIGTVANWYEGDYTVIPRVIEQTLLTNQKTMKSNVIITEIPKSDVINSAGGYTCNIGG